MTNFLKNLAISGTFALCFSEDLGAMESIQDAKNTINEEPSAKTSLSITTTASFAMGGNNFDEKCKIFYQNVNQEKLNKCYEILAKCRGIDVNAVKGMGFKPREFWDEKIETIFTTLSNTMYTCLVPAIICVHHGGFSPSHGDYPYEIEDIFERLAFNDISAFMRKKGLSPISEAEFINSLRFCDYADISKTDSKVVDFCNKFCQDKGVQPKYVRGTPLFDFFEPYFLSGSML